MIIISKEKKLIDERCQNRFLKVLLKHTKPLVFQTFGLNNSVGYEIDPGCPRPSIALQVQNHGLKHQSFHLI